MSYPLNNIKRLEINSKSVIITYNDNTTKTINIPDWHQTTRDPNTGSVTSQHHNSIVFDSIK